MQGARRNGKAPIKVLCASVDQYKNNIGKAGGQRISMRSAGCFGVPQERKDNYGTVGGLVFLFFFPKTDFGTESKKMLEMF